jgi:hypothetical protein
MEWSQQHSARVGTGKRHSDTCNYSPELTLQQHVRPWTQQCGKRFGLPYIGVDI